MANKGALTTLSLLFRSKAMWILALLCLTTASCIRWKPWLHVDRVDTDDYRAVRSAIEPDIEELFAKAEQEFARGHNSFWIQEDNTYKEYGVSDIHVEQFKKEDGTVYQVLFMLRGMRGFGEGYYYTPSGQMPPVAPNYGVICSKKVDENWYAFNTVDSMNPPSTEDCPEDIQYQ